ncbi:hypothetical protein T4B_3626 [Trichinella pseudospiralis]|uniref:Uncharacterized protein n=1 Tax=Trichinella pseudospiralis TaxID=6337 RepID=A0A0V1INR0_TRIPS|nr:hypothetical protein T4B_3626 [Trichinella pseudospiralis]KRZ24482.1 hypothetical protein T4C_8889 [Trichinella pseudospiralis]
MKLVSHGISICNQGLVWNSTCSSSSISVKENPLLIACPPPFPKEDRIIPQDDLKRREAGTSCQELRKLRREKW